MHTWRMLPGAALLGTALWLLLATTADAQQKVTILVFKDGFTLKGKIKRGTSYISDPATGATITIPTPGGFYTLDDDIRNVAFSPGQVNDAVQREITIDPKADRYTKTIPRVAGIGLPKQWQIEETPTWDEKWERVLKMRTGAGLQL